MARFFASNAEIATGSVVNSYMFDQVDIYLRHPRLDATGYNWQAGLAHLFSSIAVRYDSLVFRITWPPHRSSTDRTSKYISRALAVLTRMGLGLIEILRPTDRPCAILKAGKRNAAGENLVGTGLMPDRTSARESYGT